MIALRRLALVSLLLPLACASTPADSTTPEEGSPSADGSDPGPDRGFGPWTATVAAQHPLVGTAWSTSDGAALDRAGFDAKLGGARFVLLGETHDHPDHHRLQGEAIDYLRTRAEAEGTTLAVAYEMLDPAKQGEIDAFVAEGSKDPEAFALLVDWANSGWPEWALYEPAFAPVLAAGLPIFAAQVPRDQTKAFAEQGLELLDPAFVERYALATPLPAELQAAWLDEMFASHCEMVPREHLGPMVEIQRLRDATMAQALLDGAGEDGRAVLVAGTGHTRNSGVPRVLEAAGAESVLSVGFVAVDPEREQARDYGEDFDLVVFTPGIEREDPCVALREQMAGGAGKTGEGAPEGEGE